MSFCTSWVSNHVKIVQFFKCSPTTRIKVRTLNYLMAFATITLMLIWQLKSSQKKLFNLMHAYWKQLKIRYLHKTINIFYGTLWFEFITRPLADSWNTEEINITTLWFCKNTWTNWISSFGIITDLIDLRDSVNFRFSRRPTCIDHQRR